MGQIKTGIQELQKFLLEAPQKVEELTKELTRHDDTIHNRTGMVTSAYEVLYLYLIAKFKKTNTPLETQKGKTLKELMDPGLAENVKGVQQAVNDLKVNLGKLNVARKILTDQLLWTLSTAETKANNLKTLAQKKKDKWLKSSEYKEKIKTYLNALNLIGQEIEQIKEQVKKSQVESFTDGWVDKIFPIKPEMTVAAVGLTAGGNIDIHLTHYAKDKENIDNQVRRWRDSYKGIPGQLAIMKKWSEESDKMELIN